MKISQKIGGFVGFLVLFLGIPLQAVFAYSPYLSISDSGNGLAEIKVSSAQPYANIVFYYTPTGSGVTNSVTNFGVTDGAGNFSVTVSSGTYGFGGNSRAYAVIGNDTSNTVNGFGSGGCYGSNCGNFGASQTNVSLSIGQNATVNIYGGSGSFYVQSNSNSYVADASLNGSTLNIYGKNSGTTTIIVCSYNNSYNCVNIYVSVGGGNTSGSITFSQQNVYVNAGQSQSVSIYGGSGSFYIQNTGSTAIADAYLNGSTLTITGKSSGNTSINICSYNYGNCGSVYVQVGSGGSVGSLTFSTSNVYVNQYQSYSVNIYGGSGSFYVQSNSNSYVADASLNGSTLNIYGKNSGTTTIQVCTSGYNTGCGSVYVSVNQGGSSGSITFSQQNVYVNAGQSQSVSIYGGSGSFYVQSNSNSSAADVYLSGSNLNITGRNNGNTTLNICSYNNSNCGSVYVQVGSGSCYGTNCNTYGILSFTTLSLPQPVVGRYYNQQIMVSGGNAPYSYYLASGSLPLGLNLQNNGWVSGTVQNIYSGTFSVRVQDNQGRVAVNAYTLTPSQYGTGSGDGLIYPGGNVLGTSIYANGELLRENGTVYIVYRGTKTAFASADAFKGLGYKFSNVQYVGNIGLVDSGYIVKSNKAPHPWGSWVSLRGTVYFVHEQGLIPVPNESIFGNNGGDFSRVVPANSYDLKLSVLSVMASNDARLK